jgi:hypothetical protein
MALANAIAADRKNVNATLQMRQAPMGRAVACSLSRPAHQWPM